MKNTFLRSLRSELLKTKRTSVIWLTILAAAFIPAINCMILIMRPLVFVEKFKADPWISFFRSNWKNGSSIILPMFVILIINAITQIEYKNNTWKQVYASPRKYADIFFSKYLIVHFYLFLFFIFFNSFLLLAGCITGWVNSAYQFNSTPFPVSYVIKICARLYLGILAVTAIQYWSSVRFRNFIVPLGIGIGLWIVGLTLMDWEGIVYYPYIYSTFIFFSDSPHPSPASLSLLLTNSTISFILAIALGFWNIYNLKERG